MAVLAVALVILFGWTVSMRKEKKILVYCRSGSRSRGAAKVLIDMGYTNVHDFGGIMSWTYDKVKGE